MNNWYIIIIVIVILITGVTAATILLTNKENSGNEIKKTNGIFVNTFIGSAKDYESYIDEASNRWSSYIREDVKINITYKTFNDPNSPILASASPNSSSYLRGGGIININEGKAQSAAGFDDIIEHEICHVLGLAGNNKWKDAVLKDTSNNFFLDASKFLETAKVYKGSIFKGDGDIPLSSNGSHWREDTFTVELMTPEIGTETELKTTLLTLTAMKELGWDIDLSKAESFN